MGLSRTVSETGGNFHRKSQNFPTSCILWPLKELELGIGAWGQTRSSADADNRLDAFSGQSRSTNMVPCHMLHIVSYCAIVTLEFLRYSSSKNFMTLKGGQRSLKVIESDIIR